MSYRIYQELPDRFKADSNPDALVTLLRGDKVGRNLTGMHAVVDAILAEQIVYDSLQRHAYPPIRTLVSRHVQGNIVDSPFVSLTNRMEVAKKFSMQSDEVIYELAIPAFRLVVDPVWAKSATGTLPVEYLAIGSVEPSDIVGIVVG